MRITKSNAVAAGYQEDIEKEARQLYNDILKLPRQYFPIKYDNIPVDERLFKFGFREESGLTILHILASTSTNDKDMLENFSYVLRALAEGGVSVSMPISCNLSPLHFAAMNKNAAQIGMLLAAGAKIDAQDEGGWTPLFYALDLVSPSTSDWQSKSQSEKEDAAFGAALRLVIGGATISPYLKVTYKDNPVFKRLEAYLPGNENNERIKKLEEQVKALSETVTSLKREVDNQRFEIRSHKAKPEKSASVPDIRSNKLF
jgi:hypothetical protein